ncbi:MAG: hypothetical protein EB075_15155 [Bacteroidetes bacterium]|nr:hypothetical protein [Bacteroidota bacterium]
MGRSRAPEPRGADVGQAADAWDRIVTVLTTGDVKDVLDLYGANALYLEPYNPPHRGNLLIQSYLKDWMGGKEDVAAIIAAGSLAITTACIMSLARASAGLAWVARLILWRLALDWVRFPWIAIRMLCRKYYTKVYTRHYTSTSVLQRNINRC